MGVVSLRKFAQPFEVTTYGKWVLAGEHAVLRGLPAIVLPRTDLSLRLEFLPAASGGLDILPRSLRDISGELIRLFEKATGRSVQNLLNGKLQIVSNLPISAGMGSSAALCTALSQWLGSSIGLSRSEVFEAARQLEDYFHGESSGMDVAETFAQAPIVYRRHQGYEELDLKRLPQFKFIDTGIRNQTRDSIARVQRLWQEDRRAAEKMDQKMGIAVNRAIEGLQLYGASNPEFERDALWKIAQAIENAHECFVSWGLSSDKINQQIESLKQDGALAAKMTGSGQGGFLVALMPG